MPKKIAYLTGGICTGKTTVLQMFEKFGFSTVNADELAHEVIKKGKPAWQKIVDVFGKEILLPSGEIDRKKLGKIVFADEEKRRVLESIVHPEVLLLMQREIEKAKEPVLVEIPLIFEKGLNLRPVVVVWAPREVQIKRMIERDGITQEEAEKRLSAQLPIDKKRKLADFIIDNSGTLEETEKQVRKVARELEKYFGGEK